MNDKHKKPRIVSGAGTGAQQLFDAASHGPELGPVRRVWTGAGAGPAVPDGLGMLTLAWEEGWMDWTPAGQPPLRQPEARSLRLCLAAGGAARSWPWPRAGQGAAEILVFAGVRLVQLSLARGCDAVLPMAACLPAGLVVLAGELRLNHEVRLRAPQLAVLGAAGRDLRVTAASDAYALALA